MADIEVLIGDIRLEERAGHVFAIAEKKAFRDDYVFTPHKRVTNSEELSREMWEWTSHAYREENAMGIPHRAVFVEGPSIDWEQSKPPHTIFLEPEPIKYIWSGFPKGYNSEDYSS